MPFNDPDRGKTFSAETPGPGHNLPAREEQLRDDIMERHGHLKPRTDDLIAQIARVPDPIPEDLAPKVTDFIKSITAHVKAINGARVAEKEPHLAASRFVDGIFKNMSEPLEKGKATIEARLGKVLRAKEERQRREAEERARLEREEAERRRREADEKARLDREAAAEARRQAEEAERRAAEAAETRKREAEAAERQQREAAAQAQRELKEAEDRRIAAEAAAAEQRKKRDVEVTRARKAEEQARQDAAEAERLADQRQKEAERVAREAERERARVTAENERVARAAERTAARAEREADKAERVESAAVAKEQRIETAKPAEFARTRGDYGGVSTLQRRWEFANIDRDTLDLQKLRHFIPIDGLERAVRGFIDSGGRACDGVNIFEDDKARVA